MKLVLVTGMSGAGRGVALKTLEDCGFEAIDNLPLAFLSTVATMPGNARNLAVGTDIRGRDFSAAALREAIAPLKAQADLEFTLVFLDCDDEVLRRRFSETRRRHPLALDRTVPDGIHHERALISDVRAIADLVIDTSESTVADLRRVVSASFAGGERFLSLVLTSFSFRHGLPREADIVFDVRFVKNPHYDPGLQKLTGLDEAVGRHIERDPDYAAFFSHVQSLLLPLLPRYVEEGKHYLTIAVGCTGGRHRSVYTVQKLGAFLCAQGYDITVRHRDLDTV